MTQVGTFPNNSHVGSAKSARVLIIAYACEPGRGSEPGTGWNMAMGLSEKHHITVATRANNRSVIENFLKTHEGPHPEFLYVDPPAWTLRLKKRGVLPVQLFYYFWQREVARTLTRQKLEFDILHQLTFNSFEIPPIAFSKAKGIKIWGPIGGGQTVSRGMLPAFGRIGAFKEGLRNIRVGLSARNPAVRRILNNCSLVLFANRETERLLGRHCGGETGMMIDVGVDAKMFTPVSKEDTDVKVVILFAGRLEGRKGATLLVEAFASIADSMPETELRIVGDGPERKSLEADVSRLSLGTRVIFTGLISHSKMRREFEQADIFAFPSLRDTSGAVVLEAMAMELPVVCFDHQGAAIMVGKDTGAKIPVFNCAKASLDLAEKIRDLAADDEGRRKLGRIARRQLMDQHDWKAKVARISSYYQELLGSRS